MFTLIPYRRYAGNLARTRNSIFDDQFFRSFMNMSDMFSGSTAFRVDIKEQDDSYLLQAELPGLEQDKIQLSVDNDMLTISADFESEQKDEQTQYTYCERRSGHVERSFSLEGIDQDAISADYVNGILEVKLPKEKPLPEKTARHIPIGGQKLESGEAEQKK